LLINFLSAGRYLITDEAGMHWLYHRGKHDKRQLVVYNHATKQEIMRAAHYEVSASGLGRPSTTAGGVPHAGINTTLRKISDRYWWRGLVDDVRSFCKHCPGCCHMATPIVEPDNVMLEVGNSIANARYFFCCSHQRHYF